MLHLAMELFMAKYTNSNFIHFLKAYGPWANNEMLYEEYVRKTAKAHKIQPLEYVKPYATTLGTVKDILDAGKSKMILICGRAGDGKTHFLGKLFEDEVLLNLGSESWQALLDSDTSLLTLENVRGFDLTVVRDLSQVQEDTEAESKLFKNILLTMEEVRAQEASQNADASAASGSSDAVSSATTGGRPHLLLIAGNNGKSLEKLESLKKHLQKVLQDLQQAPDLQTLKCMDLDLTQAQAEALLKQLNKMLADLKKVFIEHKQETNSVVTIIDMSNTVNDEVLQEIFSVILEHESWSKCAECPTFNSCPIYRNRQLLRQPWLQQRLQNMLHMLKADGFHPTIRNVQSLIVNGLLGRGFESPFKSTDMSCIKVNNNIQVHNGVCDFQSNIYDNILGLNFNKITRDSFPIFKALESLNLGGSTSKSIEDFLLSQNTGYLDQRKSFIERFDCYGLYDALEKSKEALEQGPEDMDKVRKANEIDRLQEDFAFRLKNMRRLCFFCVGAPLEGELSYSRDFDCDQSADKFVNPYLLTCYPHTQEYLELERLSRAQDPSEVRINKVARKLILGLNRSFTHLFTSNDDEQVYVPASHITNLSLLYGTNFFRFNAYAYSVVRSINLVKLSNSELPVLQFVDEEQDGHRSSAELVLTPFLFETLMLLAEGMSSLCLPQLAIHKLQVFKDQIFSILEPHIDAMLSQNNVDELLSSIVRLTVGQNGHIATNRSINQKNS